MYCKNCGNTLSDDRKYCNKCGYELESKNNFLSYFFITVLLISAVISVVSIIFLWNQNWMTIEPLTRFIKMETVSFSPPELLSKLKEFEPYFSKLGASAEMLSLLNGVVTVIMVLNFACIIFLVLHTVLLFFRKKALILGAAVLSFFSYTAAVIVSSFLTKEINTSLSESTLGLLKEAVLVEKNVYLNTILIAVVLLLAVIYAFRKKQN